MRTTTYLDSDEVRRDLERALRMRDLAVKEMVEEQDPVTRCLRRAAVEMSAAALLCTVDHVECSPGRCRYDPARLEREDVLVETSLAIAKIVDAYRLCADMLDAAEEASRG